MANIFKKEYQIIEAFLHQPWKKLTFRDIQKLTGKKSKSYTTAVLQKLVKENILTREKVGNVVTYNFYLDSFKTRSFVGLVQEHHSWNSKQIPFLLIDKLSKKIPTNFFIFLVTGSYARGTQTKKSDVDIVIICEDSLEPKSIYAQLRYESEMSIPPIHLYVFRKKEFLEMLLDKGENYGKEITKNNLIFFGGASYYSILNEAMQHGFKG